MRLSDIIFKSNIRELRLYLKNAQDSNKARINEVIKLYEDNKIRNIKTALNTISSLASTNKIQLVETEYPSISVDYTQSGNILTQYRSIAQNWAISGSEIPDVNALEVAFSPQNEIDDDIISTLGYFDIGEYIGDPRQVSSPNTFYPDLNRLRDDYFKKYYENYGLFDYIRLILNY
jgi:hypothetical protein